MILGSGEYRCSFLNNAQTRFTSNLWTDRSQQALGSHSLLCCPLTFHFHRWNGDYLASRFSSTVCNFTHADAPEKIIAVYQTRESGWGLTLKDVTIRVYEPMDATAVYAMLLGVAFKIRSEHYAYNDKHAAYLDGRRRW